MKYDIVLADPPWDYYGSTTKNAAAGKHYSLMPDEELLSFDIWQWLAPKGILFMWVTCPRLDFGIKCIETWGLHFRGVPFVWVKTRQDGNIIGAQGVRPSIVKPTTEFCIAASAVKKGRPLPIADESVAQVVLAQRGRHSEKPKEVQERIERLYPDASKIELFARTPRDGWDRWGNES